MITPKCCPRHDDKQRGLGELSLKNTDAGSIDQKKTSAPRGARMRRAEPQFAAIIRLLAQFPG